MSDEYWIISVPGKSTARQTFEEVCQATGRDQLSQNFLFTIPDLKVREMYFIHSIVCFFAFRLELSIRWLLFRMT